MGSRRKIMPFRFFKEFLMVVVRLARGGAKKRPFYNIVVANSRSARDCKFIERIGFYDPIAAKGREAWRIQAPRLAHWQSQGAKVSATVARLVKQFSEKKS